ncbi:hypothetical protein ACQ4M4_25260 [Leptolyngbya sp. AN02str]|uniref:hypothetical protein n=1 Tax=Leptolyngbya sp. AN02str TaxID=3423363 RepID=UPI003D31E72B
MFLPLTIKMIAPKVASLIYLKQLVKLNSNSPILSTASSTSLIDPLDVIHRMIDLRAQLAELEQQVHTLQPAFYAACLALNTDKIELEQAIVSRRLSPGKWDYSDDIVEQEVLLSRLKKQFQHTHEPISGREVIWAVRLLLLTA